MGLAEVAAASAQLSNTAGRAEKVTLIADVLVASSEPGLAATYLSGRLPQRSVGVGWRSLDRLPAPSARSSLDLGDIDRALSSIAAMTGPGSAARRAEAIDDLFAAMTAAEQDFVKRLLLGSLRQGALTGIVTDAVASASGTPRSTVRRALMLSGDIGRVATAAMSGGPPALDAFHMALFTPVEPMLASTASSVADALEGMDAAIVDAKLDGIRVQVHRHGDDVAVYSRTLRPLQVPEVATAVRALAADTLILDGEAIGIDSEGEALSFPDTMSGLETGPGIGVRFFDILHVDGRDLIDEPLHVRVQELDRTVPTELRVDRIEVTGKEPNAAERFFADRVADGAEGVMVKALDSSYAAGRRGAAWRKVKPVYTLDLVVLAVEWGSGRRRGFLSNIHLGARGPDGFVMLGKTFKGMTDEMLAWQTERFSELETRREGHVVFVRPEQVVEVAFDGVLRSPRYPGGVSLRFARVKRYRSDKTAAEADTIDAVRSFLRRSTGAAQ